MMTDVPQDRSRLVTPTRIVVVLAAGTLVLMGTLLMVWLSRPSTITLNVTAPVGETVVCHVVVDGQARAYEDVVPVSYHFVAHVFAYAVVGTNPAGAELTVSATDHSGSGATVTAAGVKGEYKAHWWGSAWRHDHMTSTHVVTMRQSEFSRQSEVVTSSPEDSPSP